MDTTQTPPVEQEQKIEHFFAQAPGFAQPICQKLREAITQADPALQPSFKWGAPVYEKPGAGMVCSIGVFKQHVNLVFFQGALLPDPQEMFSGDQDAKNMRKIKFTNVAQVNQEVMVDYLRTAAQLPPAKPTAASAREAIEIPEDLKSALAEAGLLEKFEQMAYTHRKEYVRWVNEAKRTETRDTRLLKTVERIKEGKKFS